MDIIRQLVEQFSSEVEACRNGTVEIDERRAKYITPFFEALGWNMADEGEVEKTDPEGIRTNGAGQGGAPRAPAYCFVSNGQRPFFLEAANPSMETEENTIVAYGLRRYAWTAKTSLCVATDFAAFSVYDATVRPSRTDRVEDARVLHMTFEQYPDRFEEIQDLFHRDAVLNGSLQRYVERQGTKRRSAAVDDAFLAEIESWRERLAEDIAARNAQLTQQQLNCAVQRTIDRILFLRICEDRGIEPYGQLRDVSAGSGVYGAMIPLLKRADLKYNSGLFHFDKDCGDEARDGSVTLGLHVDDRIIKGILEGLYFPDSPFEFSVFPAGILGQVYERFLGKTIRLSSGRKVEIEDKPEVKKAGGVFYTPGYVVDYIVEHTIGKLARGKKPPRVKTLKICDPACGSGSFLLGAYQFLLDWHLRYYLECGSKQEQKLVFRGPGGQWRLATSEKKRILIDNIFGVDIDPQAVEVTKLSLLLKVLEGESEDTLNRQLSLFSERALPDLDNNIKCGNALVSDDIYNVVQGEAIDEETASRLNVFSWEKAFPEMFDRRKPGFDAIIGNPPYNVLEKDRNEASWPHRILSDYGKTIDSYKPALGGKQNMFRFFMVRSIGLIRDNGYFGMIMPLALLADISCRQTRQYLLGRTGELVVDCFPQKDNARRRVFKDAKLSTVVVTARASLNDNLDKAKITVNTYPWDSFEDAHDTCVVKFSDTRILDPKNTPIPLLDEKRWALCKKLHRKQGVVRMGDCEDIVIRRGEINQTVYREYIEESPDLARLIKGVEIGPYGLNKQLSQGKREWLNEEKLLLDKAPKEIAQRTRIGTQRITGVDERLRVVAALIEPKAYFADSTNSIHLVDGAKYAPEYLLGILNSTLIQWRFKLTSTNNNVGTNELESLPFPVIDFDDEQQRAKHDGLVELVTKMSRLKSGSEPVENETAVHRMQVLLGEIDRYVYKLFGLSKRDIALVERP